MAKHLVIVESPAKAKTIAKILGKDFTVKASAGHVRDLPKKGIGVNVKKNFAPAYEVLPEKLKVVEDLREAASKADTVYLAPDPDREGEAIAWHLAAVLDNAQVLKRIQFNEITKDAILKAIQEPRDIDAHRVDAQQARRVLDRLVGYKISPLLWIKVKRGLSAGRVQSVTVRLICDREKQVQAFVPEEYWSFHANLTKAGKKPSFEAELSRWQGKKVEVGNEAAAMAIVGALNGASYVVSSVTTKEQKRQPVAPYTTSTLQQDASKRLGMTVKRTMAVAQQLYEGIELGEEGPVGLITYMRTDSTRVAKEAQDEAREYIAQRWGKDHMPASAPQYKSKAKGAQDAHEAVRPTSIHRTPDSLRGRLTADQLKVYRMIWERFTASQMSPAKLAVKSVEIEAGEGLFRVANTEVVFDGYQAAYKDTVEEGAEEEKPIKLPPLEKGDALKLDVLQPKQHFTQPPPRYTEASLVKALEEQGIGRPSTYAPTIATVQDRGYVLKEGRALMPTELGFQVNDQLVQHFPNIVDVGFTADMEAKLDHVESGEEAWQQLIGNFYKPFAETLKVAQKEMQPVAIPSGQMCELCGSELHIKSGRFGDFLACSNYPTCKNTKPIIKKIGMHCPTCQEGDIIEKRSRMGKIFFGCHRWPDCDFTAWDEPHATPCPKCSKPYLVIKRLKRGGTFLKCADKECGHTQNLPKKKAPVGAEGEGDEG